jgi:type VI secretion system protein ImpA
MDMTDLEALLHPISDTARCGPDLDAAADGTYVELGVAAEWKDAKYVGDKEVAPDTPPDWQKVKASASALLALSKDLRIAKHYVAALTYTEGLPGFARGVHLLRDLLERYWDSLHPMLENPNDDWRKNLLTELNAERGALGGLRLAPIAESKKCGRFTLRDIEALDAPPPAAPKAPGAAPASAAPTAELLREAVRDSDAAATALRLESCTQALTDLQAIQATFKKHQGTVWPEFPTVEKLLRRGRALFNDALGTKTPAAGSPEAATGGAESQPKANGELRSRADARRQLELVCSFLERTEPSHPAPLLIRRAVRLLDLSFVDVIRDLAPEAVKLIENLGGLKTTK